MMYINILQSTRTSTKSGFVPDSRASEEQEAGPIPTSWDEFLESTLRPHRWICGLSLLAISRRYGVYIVVVPAAKGSKHKPMCFGQPKSGKQPIILLLEGGHYQLARTSPRPTVAQRVADCRPSRHH